MYVHCVVRPLQIENHVKQTGTQDACARKPAAMIVRVARCSGPEFDILPRKHPNWNQCEEFGMRPYLIGGT